MGGGDGDRKQGFQEFTRFGRHRCLAAPYGILKIVSNEAWKGIWKDPCLVSMFELSM